MLIINKWKHILYLTTILILVIKMTGSVFAESSTAFTFTLEDNNPAIEMIASDLIPGEEKAEQSTEVSLPQTGDETSPVWWIVLMFSSSNIIVVLYFSKLSYSKK